MSLCFSREIRWRCKKRNCRQDIGIRTENWFQGSILSFEDAVLFIYCWSYEFTTVEFCERELKMSLHIVVDWNSYLRVVCAWKLEQHLEPIRGPGMTN